MKITVHRGLNQIGGCITEISTETSRVFIDFGQNLPGNTATLSFEEQVKEDTLLVERILTLNKREHEAVIFTHAHEDHVGLISHLPNEMPIFMGEGTRDILLAKYDLLAHHALKQLLTKMRKEKAPSTARRKVQQQAIVAERTYFLVKMPTRGHARNHASVPKPSWWAIFVLLLSSTVTVATIPICSSSKPMASASGIRATIANTAIWARGSSLPSANMPPIHQVSS